MYAKVYIGSIPKGNWINSCYLQSFKNNKLIAQCQILDSSSCGTSEGCIYHITSLDYNLCKQDAKVNNEDGNLKCQ